MAYRAHHERDVSVCFRQPVAPSTRGAPPAAGQRCDGVAQFSRASSLLALWPAALLLTPLAGADDALKTDLKLRPAPVVVPRRVVSSSTVLPRWLIVGWLIVVRKVDIRAAIIKATKGLTVACTSTSQQANTCGSSAHSRKACGALRHQVEQAQQEAEQQAQQMAPALLACAAVTAGQFCSLRCGGCILLVYEQVPQSLSVLTLCGLAPVCSCPYASIGSHCEGLKHLGQFTAVLTHGGA